MRHNSNNENLKLKNRGPVWKTKIGIHSLISGNTIRVLGKPKKWKIKEIMN